MFCNNDSEALQNLSAVEAFATNPPGKLLARMMLAGVICDREKLKVRKSIVVLDAVPVMHVLAASEPSPQVPSHDDAMLKLERVADSNSDVPIGPDKAARVLVTSPAVH